MSRLSWNLGASTSWNPVGLSRPVMGLLYLSVITERHNLQKIINHILPHVAKKAPPVR